MRSFQYCRYAIRVAVENVRRYHLKAPCVLVASVCITFFTFSLLIAQQTETGTVSVAVNSPDIVKAGETVTFTITLDRAPNFKGDLMYWMVGPNHNTVQSSVATSAGKSIYQLNFSVPIGAYGGTWTLSELKIWSGFGAAVPLKFKPVSFQVIP